MLRLFPTMLTKSDDQKAVKYDSEDLSNFPTLEVVLAGPPGSANFSSGVQITAICDTGNNSTVALSKDVADRLKLVPEDADLEVTVPTGAAKAKSTKVDLKIGSITFLNAPAIILEGPKNMVMIGLGALDYFDFRVVDRKVYLRPRTDKIGSLEKYCGPISALEIKRSSLT